MNRHFPLLREALSPQNLRLVRALYEAWKRPMVGRHVAGEPYLAEVFFSNIHHDETPEISEFYSEKRAIPKANDHLPTCLLCRDYQCND